MADQIETALRQVFHANTMMLFRQTESKLRGAIPTTQMAGDKDFIDLVGTHDAVRITSRNQAVSADEVEHQRRMITAAQLHWSAYIDKFDKVRTLVDLNNQYSKAAVQKLSVEIDKLIITEALGTAYGGYDGTTTYAFDPNQVVPVNHGGGGSDVTLNMAKILRAKTLLDENFATDGGGQNYFVFDARRREALLANESKMTSSDYATIKALVNGEIDTWGGFKFIRSELLTRDANGDVECFAFNSEALMLGVAMEIKTDIDQIAERRNNTLVQANMAMGCVRLQEKGVVKVLCDPN